MTILFFKEKHRKYFLQSYDLLPHHYTQLDSSRLTALFFIVVALDMLASIDTLDRTKVIEFVYRLQLQPQNETEIVRGYFGFIGGSFAGTESNESSNKLKSFRVGHLAMIYTALMILLTVDDDLSRVDRENIGKGNFPSFDIVGSQQFSELGLRSLQLENGSFLAYQGEAEHDMRFVYCACAISAVLNLWDYISVPKILDFIKSCQTYEGGFGLHPGAEAQGGATYCAVASLQLLQKLNNILNHQQRCLLQSWCENRQAHGFQGRTGKVPDSCYSFWVGGTMHLLEATEVIDIQSAEDFLCNKCQHYQLGGFGKFPGDYPDLVHSFYSLSFLSFCKGCSTEDGIRVKPLDCKFSICQDRVKYYFN